MAHGHLGLGGYGHVHRFTFHVMLGIFPLSGHQKRSLRSHSIACRLAGVQGENAGISALVCGIGGFDELPRLVSYMVC